MKLTNVGRYFDRDRVYDAYTEGYLFNAQMISPAEHTTGDTFRRHTLSARDGTTAPARGVISLMGYAWLMGNDNPDGWHGGVIRRNFSLKRSSGLMNLLTPAQAALGQTGVPIHNYKEYYRDINTVTNSDYDPMWNLYCPKNEAVASGSFFRAGSIIFRVRNNYAVVEGFNVAEADEFDATAAQPATFITTGMIDPVTDTAPTISVATTVIQIDARKFYRYRSQVEADIQMGDLTVFVAQSAITPKVSTALNMLGQTWRVLSVVPEIDAWALHVRLA